MVCPVVPEGAGFVSSVTGYVDCQAQILGSGSWQALAAPGSTLTVVLTGFLTIFIALIGYNLLLGNSITVRSGTVAFVKIGAYGPGAAWVDIHMPPEQAVQVHRDVRAKRMFPVHWSTFNLAFHAWDEPIRRTVAELDPARVVGALLADHAGKLHVVDAADPRLLVDVGDLVALCPHHHAPGFHIVAAWVARSQRMERVGGQAFAIGGDLLHHEFAQRRAERMA